MAILDLRIFTNAINKYLSYLYVSGYFKNAFYPLSFKSISAILDCELRPSWANSRLDPDRFEIRIPNLPYKPMSCYYH